MQVSILSRYTTLILHKSGLYAYYHAWNKVLKNLLSRAGKNYYTYGRHMFIDYTRGVFLLSMQKVRLCCSFIKNATCDQFNGHFFVNERDSTSDARFSVMYSPIYKDLAMTKLD